MKRKRYIVNWKFQMKYCLYAILPVLLLGIIISIMIFNINKNIITSQNNQMMSQIASLETALRLLEKSKFDEKAIDELKNNIKNLKLLSQDLIGQSAYELNQLNKIVINGILVLVIGMTFLGILFSHRIVGPIFRIKRIFLELTQYFKIPPVEIRVRKYDELQDFFLVLEKVRKFLEDNQLKKEQFIDYLNQKLFEIKKQFPQISSYLEEIEKELIDFKNYYRRL